ncbi:hypothetical protein [Rhodoferax aquaticus]|nr:hypothetical protein [Rhodoferax aquaticus]
MRAESMLNTMWLNVDRTTPAATALSLQNFAHLTGTEQACNFAGAASSNNLVTAWVSDVTSGAGKLPGSTPAMQQILVDTTANNQVTITLCWQSSGDAAPRQYVLRSYVN